MTKPPIVPFVPNKCVLCEHLVTARTNASALDGMRDHYEAIHPKPPKDWPQ